MGFLIRFFLRLGLRSRRAVGMMVLGLVPVGFALLLRLMAPALQDEGIRVSEHFPQLSFMLYLHFLLPVTALFLGAGVVADEVDERTLPYLLTRPISRPSIVVAKVAAAVITAASILLVSLLLSYSLLTLGGADGAFGRNLDQLTGAAGAVLLGMAAYLAFFTLLGGLIKRPVLVGLVFIFGWESTAAFIPAKVKYLTIAHYLNVLSPPPSPDPGQQPLRALLNIVLPQQQISPAAAGLILAGIAALFTAAASCLLLLKEYRLEQST